ncbi:MAG: hypothetical protein BJ554DRAFT_5480 [Olpidium bornovanus]|uniref:Uncharacterized protein n=1 Tax=Olpidium bornovanus TaxID=278681 RepID=A0A8H7ZZC7_9FUNG|nr:MAG: hypothetical protein BJ554DRAFT_5480 [Olpidium bornovanus]
MFTAEKLMAGREERAAKDAVRAAKKAAANGGPGPQAAAAGLATDVVRPTPKPKKKVVKF